MRWVRKQSDAGDARVVMIRLTGKGTALKDEVPALLATHFDRLLGGLDDEETKRAVAFLKELRRLLGD